MDWLDEIEARGYTNDLTPDDVYRLIAEVRTIRADFSRVTAERDELVRVLPEVCHGECSGDPGVGWPACVLWEYGEPNEHGHPTRGHCKYAPPHNYIGEEAVAGPEEVQDESN